MEVIGDLVLFDNPTTQPILKTTDQMVELCLNSWGFQEYLELFSGFYIKINFNFLSPQWSSYFWGFIRNSNSL